MRTTRRTYNYESAYETDTTIEITAFVHGGYLNAMTQRSTQFDPPIGIDLKIPYYYDRTAKGARDYCEHIAQDGHNNVKLTIVYQNR